MPLLATAAFKSPFYLFNGHVQTIVPSLWRQVNAPAYERERISTPDGDFLDLDWARTGSSTLAIISHGLEGDTNRPYVRGMAAAMNQAGLDALAWNFRGCSGEANRLLRAYHSGATEDLEAVLRHVWQTGQYAQLVLIGFSLGGNMTLKYVGERGAALDERIRCAVAISVPCDLESGAEQMKQLRNRIYLNRFLKTLRLKVQQKGPLLPEEMRAVNLDELRDFFAFDDFYTAPAHGFENARAYYHACSSKQFLPQVQGPVLILNAQNDPFLSPECYPVAEAAANPYVHLEMPKEGGHVGFCLDFGKDLYYSEQRTVTFVQEQLAAPHAS